MMGMGIIKALFDTWFLLWAGNQGTDRSDLQYRAKSIQFCYIVKSEFNASNIIQIEFQLFLWNCKHFTVALHRRHQTGIRNGEASNLSAVFIDAHRILVTKDKKKKIVEEAIALKKVVFAMGYMGPSNVKTLACFFQVTCQTLSKSSYL